MRRSWAQVFRNEAVPLIDASTAGTALFMIGLSPRVRGNPGRGA